jgi:hypothetical protein
MADDAETCQRGHLLNEATVYEWVDPKTGRTKRTCRECDWLLDYQRGQRRQKGSKAGG